MKRKNNLYNEICKIENIMKAAQEVCKNTRNKKKVNNFKEYKSIYISRIYSTLKNRTYKVGPYNVFTIYEPKERTIVSQNIVDKIINHLVARYILSQSLEPCLIHENVASLKNKGTKAGLEYFYKYNRICTMKYQKYYVLKCDISKYFYSIDHETLKEKIKRKIKDKDALKIVFDIIDSLEKGLGIGSMTSQVLAVFYLNDMDHFIKEKLKIKYYVRYQDDFLLYHQSKEYLKYCLEEIKKFLEKENLVLNQKSRIYSGKDNFIFLGRNKKGRYAKYRTMKRKLKKKKYLYENGIINLCEYMTSIKNFKNLNVKIV